jgi:hypothetical protein
MLNLDNNKIKTEISFAGIEYIKEDPNDDRVIYFKYKVHILSCFHSYSTKEDDLLKYWIYFVLVGAARS